MTGGGQREVGTSRGPVAAAGMGWAEVAVARSGTWGSAATSTLPCSMQPLFLTAQLQGRWSSDRRLPCCDIPGPSYRLPTRISASTAPCGRSASAPGSSRRLSSVFIRLTASASQHQRENGGSRAPQQHQPHRRIAVLMATATRGPRRSQPGWLAVKTGFGLGCDGVADSRLSGTWAGGMSRPHEDGKRPMTSSSPVAAPHHTTPHYTPFTFCVALAKLCLCLCLESQSM